MNDFIKSMNLSEKFKMDEFYSLFKSDSSKFNSNLFASLKKIHSTKDFLNYSNGNIKIILENLNNIFPISFKLEKKGKENEEKEKIDKYITSISNISSLFLLIQKNIESLNSLINTIKNYIQKLYKEDTINENIKEKIISSLNDLVGGKIFSPPKNLSRRSTKEYSFEVNTDNEKPNLNINEIFFPEMITPKFENINEKENLTLTSIKDAINFETSIVRMDSNLTLSKMNFVFEEELGPKAIIEKTKSHDDYQKPLRSKKKNKFEDLKNIIKSKDFIYEFLNEIYTLYKEKKISLQKKLELKQLIISDYQYICEKFNKNYDMNDGVNENIKRFLLEYIKDYDKNKVLNVK